MTDFNATGAGIDPYWRQSITNYLMNGMQGPNPFDLTATDFTQPVIYPEDMDEYGTIDYARDNFNMQQDAYDVMSDPAFIATLGTGAGGWGPEQFPEQQYEYERIQSPALNTLTAYSQGNDVLKRIIADQYLDPSGGGAMGAESMIRTALTEPTHPYHEALMSQAALFDLDGNIDLDRIQKEVAKVEDVVIKDPVFPSITQQGFDQAATNPGFTDGTVKDSQVVIGDDGMAYVKREREKTDAEEYLSRAGFSSTPYDTYNPDDLASPDVLAAENRAFEAEAQARQAEELANIAFNEEYSSDAMRQRAQEAMTRMLLEEGGAGAWTPGQGRPAGAPRLKGDVENVGNMTIGEATDSAGNAIARGLTGIGNWTSANLGGDAFVRQGGVSDEFKEKGQQQNFIGPSSDPLVEQAKFDSNPLYELIQKEHEKKVQARTGLRDVESDRRRASLDSSQARYAQNLRNTYANELAQAGFNPFQDELRGRAANAYGGLGGAGAAPAYVPPPPSTPRVNLNQLYGLAKQHNPGRWYTVDGQQRN